MNDVAYIGTKLILARPMNRRDFLWETKGEASVDYSPGYRVTYPDGYVSWSPKDTFEEAYRPVSVKEQMMVRGVRRTDVNRPEIYEQAFPYILETQSLELRYWDEPSLSFRPIRELNMGKEENSTTTDTPDVEPGYMESLIEDAENH